ncbi:MULTISPECIES: ABC transporter ATP-binding protein [Alphaproteobacteria]|uniref:Spermidine/putrescine ABC transporter n=2 Tax=Alphaproteobacteria TaxID=28211 RepID=A0A512HL38_9HYPH|nr:MULTISPECIES: ABC transporter ATP-binding protein [Alphaproteobacteria]GEO86155.1 spermidine/putrescine ABC transporter [Ciceribacter naphthalenivorans]GLR22722.1 spermidine/putrescine ABC transporter [Ciceribacter naphthalenivorans]GLT05578.1 spermidine/putrescine ABC transporter [Sphingomonas psychrolutea]
MATEALLSLSGVNKVFANDWIGLANIDLTIAQGEFVSLLGPSGCGKTTTLRVIAGFEMPTSGSVRLGGREITYLRPFDRPVNTVFQDYAIFPHMDVSENVGFGLSIRKVPAAEQRRRILSALELVGLADKAQSRVQALSGGQRQRVALARAIVCEPQVLLLDEPLSALDAHLREQMQVELKSLQSRLGTTFVMVTHDQTEALSISDRIAVMNKARIEQVASPAELYDNPATKFVASFIGTMNLLPAISLGAEGGSIRLDANGLPALVPADAAASAQAKGAMTLGVRPEDLLLAEDSTPDSAPLTITSIVFHGRSLRVHGDLQSGREIVLDIPRESERSGLLAGQRAHVRLRPGAACSLLPA